MTTKEFCKKLAEHLEKDNWGWIDPDVFRAIAEDDPDGVTTEDGSHCIKQYLQEIFGK